MLPTEHIYGLHVNNKQQLFLNEIKQVISAMETSSVSIEAETEFLSIT
jgi:hypothetical protein